MAALIRFMRAMGAGKAKTVEINGSEAEVFARWTKANGMRGLTAHTVCFGSDKKQLGFPGF
ncbi:hypothetical protein POG20_18060 [Blautia wexlerae]|nr:hypothetical protein [Blautia wexlerae]